MKLVSLLSTILIILSISTKAISPFTDSTIKESMYGANLYSGVLMYHHKEMEILREKSVNAFEISWIFVGNGDKLWHKAYSYPEYGLSYVLIDLGSPSILGFSHGLLPFINFPVTEFSRKFSAGFRVGSGISYVTKTYHRTENYKNSAISTHINAQVMFSLEGRYNLSKNIATRVGLHLNHISNGTFKKPNSGLNYPMLSFGLAYCHNHQKSSSKHHLSYNDELNRILFFGFGSRKEEKGAGGPKYLVGAFSVEYTRPIRTLWRYGFSLDLMYDESTSFLMEYKEIPYDSKWQTVNSGVTVNTEIMLDRLSAVFYFGKYIKNSSYEGGPFYQRIGLRYRIHDYFWLHLALKTHWASADYLELGLGFKII